jgi:multidrug efflux pump subunit AcrA (membrane-fusion protein)
MAVRTRLMTVFVVMLLAALPACSDNSELESAREQISELESARATLEASNATLEESVASLESAVADLQSSTSDLEGANSDLSGQVTALADEKETLEATLASTGQQLILQADIVGDGCMLQNAYVNDGEAKATFRVRVYDPITGEQLDDEALDSVTVELGDGQVFDLRWGPHPPDTENDFFWTYGWEIFSGYPAGNVSYLISATAADGRTGVFEPFNVVPSLLTVMDVEA